LLQVNTKRFPGPELKHYPDRFDTNESICSSEAETKSSSQPNSWSQSTNDLLHSSYDSHDDGFGLNHVDDGYSYREIPMDINSIIPRNTQNIFHTDYTHQKDTQDRFGNWQQLSENRNHWQKFTTEDILLRDKKQRYKRVFPPY